MDNKIHVKIDKGLYAVPEMVHVPRIGEIVKHGGKTRKVKKVVHDCRNGYVTIYL